MELDSSTTIPLYVQIATDLRRKIECGDLRPGQKIGSQQELCVEYGVSRITVRRAVAELKTLGIVSAQTGRGTFVSRNGKKTSLLRTKSIGLVLRDFTSPFFSNVMLGVEERAYATGYNLLFSNSSQQAAKEEYQIEHFGQIGVNGIIVASMRNTDKPPPSILSMHGRGYPYVMVSYVGDPHYRYVGVDHFRGAFLAGKHLAACGYDRIGYVNAEASNLLGDERKKGFVTALAEAGYSVTDLWETALEDRWDITRFEKGFKAAEAFLSASVRPDALFIYNDQAAYGFWKRLEQSGVRVPHDVGIMGFDGAQSKGLFDSVLTTIQQPMREIGKVAVDMLLDQIGGRATARRILLEPRLLEGDTTQKRTALGPSSSEA